MAFSGTISALLVQAVKNNILPLTGRCNLNCVFCSHHHMPSGVEVYDFPPLPRETLYGLMDNLDPHKKIVIGESVTRLREGEPFSHPHFLDILRELRKRYPETMLQVTTNGSLLVGETLKYLAALKPMELVLSLNSASPEGRRGLMGDLDPRTAIDAAIRLGRYGIAFHGSVVAMPHLAGEADLKETLVYLDRCGALTVRLFFPGFTRFSPPFLRFSPEQERQTRSLVQNMQDLLDTPILPDPPGTVDLTPRVEGIIKGSPAQEAGLIRGHIILSINGAIPRSRVEAFNLIVEQAHPCVRIRDKAGERETVIRKDEGAPSGITMLYDLHPGQVEKVKRQMARFDRVLLLTSPAAAPLWEAARAPFSLPQAEITAVAPEFWGGSISCAGLLTVEDYAGQLKRMKLHQTPEAVFLPPDSFDHRGMDLRGRSYLELLSLFKGRRTRIFA